MHHLKFMDLTKRMQISLTNLAETTAPSAEPVPSLTVSKGVLDGTPHLGQTPRKPFIRRDLNLGWTTFPTTFMSILRPLTCEGRRGSKFGAHSARPGGHMLLEGAQAVRRRLDAKIMSAAYIVYLRAIRRAHGSNAALR